MRTSIVGSALAALAALVMLLVDPGAARAADEKLPPADERPLYVRAFATSGAGMGLRFNNPYRLSRQLGDDARGLSTTAPYLDLGVGATFGDPFGFQHGGTLRWDRALSGVGQQVVTPSYVGLRRWTAFEVWGRFGLPIVLTPDRNLGTELAVGGAWFVRAGVGLALEAIGDVFFGASTPEKRQPVYPVLSGQLGVLVEWERLP
ncbi:MAG: hypothetical protein NVSMB47_18230 [Polyangiales bacterium]